MLIYLRKTLRLASRLYLPVFISAFISVSIVKQLNADDVDFLRVSHDVDVEDSTLKVKFYTAYEKGRITVTNRTPYRVRYSSFQGFVGIIAPNDSFDMPCVGDEVSGQIDFPVAGGAIEVSDYPFCGDYVEILVIGS